MSEPEQLLKKLTIKQIKERLDSYGILYKSKMKKAELVALLIHHLSTKKKAEKIEEETTEEEEETEEEEYICDEMEDEKEERMEVYKINRKTNRKELVSLHDIPPTSPCFQRIPECKKTCRDVIKNKNYPCRMQRTIFDNREDYLEFKDLKVKGDYKRRERSHRAKLATQELKKAKTIKKEKEKKIRFHE